MENNLSSVTLLVKDYDDAIEFYTKKAGFNVVVDTTLSPTKRFVIITPSNSSTATGIMLSQANSNEELNCVGNQCGGRVIMILKTTDFDQQYADMVDAGVKFLEEPRDEEYGKVVVWEDLYGNKWDLIQRKS